MIIFMRYFFFHKIICQNAVSFVIRFVLNKRLSSWIIIYSIFSVCVQLHNNVFIKLLILSSIHYIISSLEVLIFSSFSQKGHTNDTLKKRYVAKWNGKIGSIKFSLPSSWANRISKHTKTKGSGIISKLLEILKNSFFISFFIDFYWD